jgi:hypothetical protein
VQRRSTVWDAPGRRESEAARETQTPTTTVGLRGNLSQPPGPQGCANLIRGEALKITGGERRWRGSEPASGADLVLRQPPSGSGPKHRQQPRLPNLDYGLRTSPQPLTAGIAGGSGLGLAGELSLSLASTVAVERGGAGKVVLCASDACMVGVTYVRCTHATRTSRKSERRRKHRTCAPIQGDLQVFLSEYRSRSRL